jgi:hypothetical protein
MWTKLLLLLIIVPKLALAADFVTEDWETGTPPACWPCKSDYCTDEFNNWYTDYGDTVESSGLSTTQKNSGSLSFYNYKESSNWSGCPITQDISGSPTTIYLRFYLYFGTSWNTYPTNATGDPLIHWVFTNSQAGSTGFRLNLTTSDHWGDCPVGDLCLLPEGDGGHEWWEGDWTSTAADDFLQYVGVWTCFEYKMQISGSNIILTEYINGELTRGPVTDVGQNTGSFNKIIFHLWDNPAGSYTMDYYLDDIVVSDAYIGPIDTETPSASGITRSGVTIGQ